MPPPPPPPPPPPLASYNHSDDSVPSGFPEHHSTVFKQVVENGSFSFLNKYCVTNYLGTECDLFLFHFNILKPEKDGRQHFQMHFLEWKWLKFKENLAEVCSHVANIFQIGLGDGLAHDRQQTFTWTNNDSDLWHNMESLCHNELTHWRWVMHICISKLGHHLFR